MVYRRRKSLKYRRIRRAHYIANFGKHTIGYRQIKTTIPYQVHKFKRIQEYTVNVTDVPTIANYANDGYNGKFKLGALANFNEFTSLFDQYRITGVKVNFIFSASSSNAGSTYQSTQLPLIWIVEDYDDGSVLTSVLDYQQYGTVKVRRLNNPITKFVRPKPAQSVYQSGTFSGYAQGQRNTWIDMQSPQAEYYGIKWGIEPCSAGTGTNTLGTLKVLCTYYIQCRDTR